MSTFSVNRDKKRKREEPTFKEPAHSQQPLITQSSIASFFISSSEKPQNNIIWQARSADDSAPDTLLVGRYLPSSDPDTSTFIATNKCKTGIAAFDLDSTLIRTKSGKVYASNAHDWKWWHATVPGKLQKLHYEDNSWVVVISNQAGLSLKSDISSKSKLSLFKNKISEVFNQLNIPIIIYAATEKDLYRKPRTKIWEEVLKDFSLEKAIGNLSLDQCTFVGDAAGRQAWRGKHEDFSCSDRNFAENIGLRFSTPEEYFLGDKSRPFIRSFEPSDYLKSSLTKEVEIYTRRNKQDIIILCGSPGAGKSTWYWKNLEPLGYFHINQDSLKTRDNCMKVASQYLDDGKSVAVDNTNRDVKVRSKWVNLASKYNVPIRCVHLKTPTEICVHNDIVRALNSSMNPEKRTILPGIAFNAYKKQVQNPNLNEGFQDITEIPFRCIGSDSEKAIWNKHWV